MTSRRTLLIGMTAGVTGVAGAVFGSGAFTTVEADRDFVVDLADDDASQLVIAPNEDLPSRAVDVDEDDGVLDFDAEELSRSSIVSYGFFDDLEDSGTLQQGVIVIRNENETGEPVDISVGFGDTSDDGLDGTSIEEFDLALLPSDDSDTDDVQVTSPGDDDAEIDGVPAFDDEEDDEGDEEAATVEVGFRIVSETTDEEEPDEFDAEIEITAVRQGADPGED
ncbi:hypothetical protein JCM18237_22570 [Halorubrum luteum]